MATGFANNPFMYHLVSRLAYGFYRILFGLKVFGRERFPAAGPYIVAANHQSNLDPLLMGCICPRYLHAMGKIELFSTPVKRWFFNAVNTIPLDRSRGDVGAIKTVLSYMERGATILMFPEGTRSRDGLLRPANAGVGMLVAKARVPVVPCYIAGTCGAPGGKKRRRRAVRVFFGEPLHLYPRPGDDPADRKALYAGISDRIMDAIRRLKDDYEKNPR